MKLFLLCLLSIICLTANSQIPKGSKLLGGSLSFNYEDVNKTTSFGISTQFAKAYKDNKFRGFQFGYVHGNQPNSRLRSYYGGIFFRRYVPVAKDFYFFGQASFNLGYYSVRNFALPNDPSATRSKSENYSISISLAPGLSYAVSKKIHLEIALRELASLQFDHQVSTQTTNNITQASKASSIGLNTSTQLNSLAGIQFGLRFLFSD